MHGAQLAELSIFLRVAHHKSFKQAAVERNVAPSAISYAIRSLEARLGVRLFHRTTRSVSLTEAGSRLLLDVKPAFDQIELSIGTLDAFRGQTIGTVKLNVPKSIAPYALRNVMGNLLLENPGLKLEIVATDRLVDIVEEGFDAGIRFGERLAKDMIAVRIKPKFRFAVVGSRAYFLEKPIPAAPKDLARHACIRYRFPSGIFLNWEFEKDGVQMDVEVDGPITLDDQELMVEAALQGCGLAYVWEDRVVKHISEGALIRCLEDWCPTDGDLFLYYPSTKYLSSGLRAMIDILKR